MFNAKFKSRASRRREMRENLSIIIASQKSKLPQQPPPPSASMMSQYAIRSGKVTIANVPKLAECPGPQPSVRVRSGWHSIHASQPVVRNPIQVQPSAPTPSPSFRKLPFTPFLCRQVQGPNALPQLPLPPQTPRPSTGAGTRFPSTLQRTPKPKPKPNGVILQSPWVQRGELSTDFAKRTMQYSIKQLVDILCGDAEAIPPALKNPMTNSIFKCPLGVGIGMETEAARSRKLRKVSFNDIIEMTPIPTNIFPVAPTPFQDTTNFQHIPIPIPTFTTIFDQNPDPSKRKKIDESPLELSPSKSITLFPLDENGEDDTKSFTSQHESIDEIFDSCLDGQDFFSECSSENSYNFLRNDSHSQLPSPVPFTQQFPIYYPRSSHSQPPIRVPTYSQSPHFTWNYEQNTSF